MAYKGLYRNKISTVVFDDDGETYTFYLRKPRAIELIKHGDEQKAKEDGGGKKPNNETVNRETIERFVVNEDGTQITKDDLEELMGMEMSTYAKLSEFILAAAGTKKKDDEQKNV